MEMMARPRVLIATPHAPVAVTMTTALEARGYRVSHVFDRSVAAARAEIELDDALVMQLDEGTPRQLESYVAQCPRVGLVFVSACPRVTTAAALMQLGVVPQPYTSTELVRAVQRAVAWSHPRKRHSSPGAGQLSGTHRIDHVLVIASDASAGEVVAGLIRHSLGIRCTAVRDLDEARQSMAQPVVAVLAAPDCLLPDAGGAAFVRELVAAQIPLLPLETDGDRSDAALAAAAWKIIPELRRALDDAAAPRSSQVG